MDQGFDGFWTCNVSSREDVADRTRGHVPCSAAHKHQDPRARVRVFSNHIKF